MEALKLTNYDSTTEQQIAVEQAVDYYMRCQFLREALNGMSKHQAIISRRLNAPKRYKLAMEILKEFNHNHREKQAYAYMTDNIAVLEEEFLKYAHMFLWYAGLHNEWNSNVIAAGKSVRKWNILIEDAWKEFSERQTIHV